MAARAITRADLSEAVYQEVGLSRRESAELVGSAGARGEAEAITRKSDIADGMSEAGGIPDLPWASPEGPFIAKSGSSELRKLAVVFQLHHGCCVPITT